MSDFENKKVEAMNMVLYLLKCYPNCADEGTEDHKDFINDMSDMLALSNMRLNVANRRIPDGFESST
jgi:hypothetical protein